MIGRCKDCRFYEVGTCHRYPPIGANPESVERLPGYDIFVFPSVCDGDWCGEFKKEVKDGNDT